MFREINFATVRVLIANNIQVVIPEGQGCCGAFQEHTGLDGVEELRAQNRNAFIELLRRIVDGEIPPVEAVKVYHSVLQKSEIRPQRSLQQDLLLTANKMSYR